MIRDTPLGFEVFKDIMLKYYVTHFEKYMKFLDKRMDKNGEQKLLKLYSMSSKLDYNSLQENMLMVFSEFEILYK